jgi:hypothetical protein
MQVMCRPAYLDDYSSEYYGSTQRRPRSTRLWDLEKGHLAPSMHIRTYARGRSRRPIAVGLPRPSAYVARSKSRCWLGWSLSRPTMGRTYVICKGWRLGRASYLLPAPRLAMQAEADVRSAASSAPLRSFKRRSPTSPSPPRLAWALGHIISVSK